MPEIMALTCPVCGAPLDPNAEKCTFCGSFVFIRTDLPRLDRHSLNQSVIQEHIRDFRRRTRIDQYDEEAHYGLGVAYFTLGLLDDAVEQLTQAARLMPENPHIQAQLAVVLRDSFRNGNQTAEQQMNTRIQSALLLDPTHGEATMLKVEVLLDDKQYAEAVALYQALGPELRERAKPKIVSVLERVCEQRLTDEKWSDARWCWDTLEPVDASTSHRLALRFLNLHPSLVPRFFKLRAPSPRGESAVPARSEATRSSRTFRRIAAALVGLFAGFVLLAVVAALIPSDETNGMSGWGTAVFGVSFLIFLASPFIGVVVYNRRARSNDPPGTTPQSRVTSDTRPAATTWTGKQVTRKEMLGGAVDLGHLHQIVDVVMEKLDNQEKMRAFQAARSEARAK